MHSFRFSVVIEKDEDGSFAFCPQLQGCYASGASYEEAVENIRDVIALHVEDRRACGETVPEAGQVSLTTIEISV